jgi:large subunit ribosomal protein L21
MYAVVSSGGKQYRVEAGGTLVVERLAASPGDTVTFDRVLLVGDGDTVTVGTPLVDGVTVRGTIIGEERGPKIVVFKFKQKVKYRRRTGHRQQLTRVRIDAIDSGREAKGTEPEAVEAPPEAVEAAPEKPKARRRPKAAPEAPAAETAEPGATAQASAPAEQTDAEKVETKQIDAAAPEVVEAKPARRRTKASPAASAPSEQSEAPAPAPRTRRRAAPKKDVDPKGGEE